MELLSKASQAATSKIAQRTLVNVGFLIGTSLSLLPFAVIGSIFFFYNYLPDQVVTSPVHLQYGLGANPFGTAMIPMSALKTRQEYDISVTLSLPRSPANTHRGNFMIALYLLDASPPSAVNGKVKFHSPFEPYSNLDDKYLIFFSRRPALIPYQDPLVSVASRLIFLAYHLLFADSQTCVLTVPMAERVELAKGLSLPSSAYLEIHGGQSIETYYASVTLTARLRGLRWLMYHYRLATLMCLVLLFWASEVLFMAMAWLMWSALSRSGSRSPIDVGKASEQTSSHAAIRIKREDGVGVDELSDAPMNFPTYRNHAPLRYEPETKEGQSRPRMEDFVAFGGEADDEKEDDRKGNQRGDTEIGTSYSEGGSGSVPRGSSNYQ